MSCRVAISPLPSTKPGESFFNVHVLPCDRNADSTAQTGKRELYVLVFRILQSFVNDGQEIFDAGVRPSQKDQLLFRVPSSDVQFIDCWIDVLVNFLFLTITHPSEEMGR